MRNEHDANQALLDGVRRACPVPPAGWYCTRERGHDGPCAALPYTREEYEPCQGDWSGVTKFLLGAACIVFVAVVVGAFL
jgi:hypothetical protein